MIQKMCVRNNKINLISNDYLNNIGFGLFKNTHPYKQELLVLYDGINMIYKNQTHFIIIVYIKYFV